MFFKEDTFERAVLEIFEGLGYTHIYGPELERDYGSPLLESVLRESLLRINRGLPAGAITEALAKLKDFGSGSLLQTVSLFDISSKAKSGTPSSI